MNTFFEGITITELVDIHIQLEENKVKEEQYRIADENFNWYKNRFIVPSGMTLKFYKDILKDTKEYIKYHKDLWRKNRDNTFAEDSLKNYIEKEKKLVQRIRYLTAHKETSGKYDIQEAKKIPITNFMEFDRAGFAKCLWHKEKTGSLKYNKDKNKVHCFGSCGISRDVIDVVQQQRGITIGEAIKFLCQLK